jgi:hypothetical protein
MPEIQWKKIMPGLYRATGPVTPRWPNGQPLEIEHYGPEDTETPGWYCRVGNVPVDITETLWQAKSVFVTME